MARLASEARLGFYPAAPEAVRAAMRHVALGSDLGGVLLFDPCAGEGEALRVCAECLGVPQEDLYLIELDEGRSARIAEAMPRANLLGPATFLGVGVSYNCFSFAWVNPPFQDELGGGGREEMSFLRRAWHYLAPKGVVCFVAPTSCVGKKDFGREFESLFDEVRAFKFPRACRKYQEWAVLGRRRERALPWDKVPPGPLSRYWRIDETHRFPHLGEEPDQEPLPLPAGRKPRRWLKTDFTPAELERALAASPLNRLFEPPPEPEPARPPLPLNKGQVALLLASGRLDGLVEPEGEGPHVVRGTARKETYLANQEVSEDEKGAVTTKEVYAERVVLTVRAVAQDGEIRTFSQ